MRRTIAEFRDVPSKTITLSMRFGEHAITRAEDPLLFRASCARAHSHQTILGK